MTAVDARRRAPRQGCATHLLRLVRSLETNSDSTTLPWTCQTCEGLRMPPPWLEQTNEKCAAGKHVSNSGATVKPTNITYTHIVMEVLVTIMNCTRSWLMIRKQLMQSPANGTPSPEQQRIQKYYSLTLNIRIKPQQLRHLMMSGICLDVRRLFAWMKKSWTFSVLNPLHGTASKTCAARRMSNLPRGSGLRYNKPNMPFSEPSFTTTPPLLPQSQLGKRWCSAAGFFWVDRQSSPLRATAHTFWMRDWSFFGLRIGLLSGPWYAPNVISLQCKTPHVEPPQNRNSHGFARLPH